MKNCIIYFLYIILSGNWCLAQKSEGVKMKVRKTNFCIGVELPNLNVFYRGIENRIHLVYSGNCPIVVKIDNGLIVDNNEGNYSVYVNEGQETAISIYEERGKKLNLIGIKNYRIKSVPQPIAMFSGKKNGEEISKSQLLNGGGLTISLNEFLYDVKYEIVSYDISLNVGGEFRTEENRGESINDSQYALLGKLKNRACVVIENIKVKQVGSNGNTITLPPITLKVNG